MQKKGNRIKKQSIQDIQSIQSEKQAQPKRAAQVGLPRGWRRATFILTEEHFENLKAMAYWQRQPLKELVAEVIDSYLKRKKESLSQALALYGKKKTSKRMAKEAAGQS